jgi:tRNA threonylcarbamoyladenosine biosynthesis protein TsaB
MILCIETATGICSAALCDEQSVISVLDAPPGMSHAARLTVIIRKLLAEASINARDLDAVAVSKGPGSYTGLRIGVSVAKGITYGAGIPLIGINTLLAMCHGYLIKNPLPATSDVLLCPMIDARRMEVYNALLRPDGTFVRETSADIINESSYKEVLAKNRIVFFGNGAEKCKDAIRHPNAIFYDDFTLSASYLHIPAVNAVRNGQFEDVAYFEPYYLKEFIATTPRKLLP